MDDGFELCPLKPFFELRKNGNIFDLYCSWWGSSGFYSFVLKYNDILLLFFAPMVWTMVSSPLLRSRDDHFPFSIIINGQSKVIMSRARPTTTGGQSYIFFAKMTCLIGAKEETTSMCCRVIGKMCTGALHESCVGHWLIYGGIPLLNPYLKNVPS